MARANVTFNECVSDSLKRINSQIISLNDEVNDVIINKETFLHLHNEIVDIIDSIYNITELLNNSDAII